MAYTVFFVCFFVVVVIRTTLPIQSIHLYSVEWYGGELIIWSSHAQVEIFDILPHQNPALGWGLTHDSYIK